MKSIDFVIIIVAIIILTGMGMSAVVMMGMHPLLFDKSLIPVVVGLIAPTILSLLATVKSYQNGVAIKEVHMIMNSRLTELLAKTAESATLIERAANAKTLEDSVQPEQKHQPPEG
jgi:hypothetical protein